MLCLREEGHDGVATFQWKQISPQISLSNLRPRGCPLTFGSCRIRSEEWRSRGRRSLPALPPGKCFVRPTYKWRQIQEWKYDEMRYDVLFLCFCLCNKCFDLWFVGNLHDLCTVSPYIYKIVKMIEKTNLRRAAIVYNTYTHFIQVY